MKNLTSMTDFVLEQGTEINTGEMFYRRVWSYANFLKQPLKLGMFVPCDEGGNVLEKPREFKNKFSTFEEYKQAKERCLFNGFEVIEHPYLPDDKSIVMDEILHVFWHNKITGWNLSMGVFVIEDLVKYNPILTETAIKQLGL